jgi:hypothetical protein
MKTVPKTIIQTEEFSFRLPNTMRAGLGELAKRLDVHVSHVVRIACSELLKQARETGKITQRVD